MPDTGTLTSSARTPSAQLLDVRAVAAILNCSARTVYRLADGGLMPRPRKLGSLVRWSKSEIEAWIAAGCPQVRTKSKGGA
jgi:excisionase family DNA binding protein